MSVLPAGAVGKFFLFSCHQIPDWRSFSLASSIIPSRHRPLYRIRKIQDILQMDLDQPDVRLILQIAFRVLDDAGSDT